MVVDSCSIADYLVGEKMKQKFLLLVLLFCLIAVGSVSALNMSISDLGYTGTQTIQIYQSDGTLYGTYNSSTDGILLPADDFNVVIKPTVWNQDIGSTIGTWFAWLAEYWVAIVFLMCALVMGISLGRR